MYTKFNINVELRKYFAGKPMKTTPDVLLHILGEDYLAGKTPSCRPARRAPAPPPPQQERDPERHMRLRDKAALSVAEAAELTGFSHDTIMRLFRNEKGVLVINRPTTNRKRRYRSLRIPRPVYERVVARLSV
jgi:hypothetical protein